MRFLPIVGRELIEASRRRSTFWVRLGAATTGLIIGAFVLLVSRRSHHPGEIGMAMFVPLAILTYLYCLLAGVFRTADCLSEEKREGTLGLLFLTDLKGYDIVFGKLVATSMNAIYGLLAIFPVMAIPLLAGGVSVDDVWRVALVALNNLFFSLSVGMFCSAISRDERRAMVLGIVVVIFFAGGVPLLAAMLQDWRHSRAWSYVLLAGSPAYPCFLAFEEFARTAGARNYFVGSVSFIHALSWLLLLSSCVIVPRTWQDRALTAAATRRRDLWHRLAHGSAEWRRAVRRRFLEINPVYWLSARDRLKGFFVWLFLGAGGLIWTLGLIFAPRGWKDNVAYFWTALITHTVLKIWLVSEAARRFSLDRQSGALELLLSTPLPVGAIIRGQTQALERQFAGPAAMVLLADFIFLMADRDDSKWVYLMVTGMVALVADLIALAWVGMWRGLNSRRPNRAAAAAIARVLVLPWVLFALMLMLFLGVGNNSWLSGEERLLTLWLGIGIGANLLFGLPARKRLYDEFRLVATTRFERKG